MNAFLIEEHEIHHLFLKNWVVGSLISLFEKIAVEEMSIHLTFLMMLFILHFLVVIRALADRLHC